MATALTLLAIFTLHCGFVALVIMRHQAIDADYGRMERSMLYINRARRWIRRLLYGNPETIMSYRRRFDDDYETHNDPSSNLDSDSGYVHFGRLDDGPVL